MVPNAFFLGSQAIVLAEHASNPFDTASLKFWTTDVGKNALDIISQAGFKTFVMHF